MVISTQPEQKMTTIQMYSDRQTLKLVVKGRKWLRWSGILLIVVGLAAVIFPMAATIATQLFIGWLFVFAGAFHLLTSFSYRRGRAIAGAILVNLLTIALGVFLITNPAVGAIALTILIAIMFVLHGVVGLFMAFMIKPFDGWRWLLVSAVVTALVGMLIGAGLPGTSLVLLGLLVGISLIISGLSCLVLARAISTKN